MFWGLSCALDLVAEFKNMKEVAKGSEINVLLIGSTDARHILKTMSHLKRHPKELKVNFYVTDTAEVLVRQMLLLTIALEPSNKLGPLEKSRIWMEVYGNVLLRSSTAKYIVSKMLQLRHMMGDKSFLEKRMPLLDLSLLRYTDIDYLDEVAKYYQNNKKYAITRAWDELLRDKLEEEYDYRFGHFDFDYGVKLFRIPGGHRVSKSEYIHWRSTGIAFTWLETDYSVGNPTLAVGIGTCGGDDLYSHGYIGDMESGPYFAFGTDSEEKKMLEVRNDVNVRRATDITERNLQRLFHELEHGSPPSDLYSTSIDLGLVMMKPGNVDVGREVTLEYEPDRTPEDYSAIPVPNCKVFFLPGNAMEMFPKKPKYQEFFDITFVAQNFFKFLDIDIMSMMKPTGCLIIETRKFVISVDEDSGNFGKEVRKKLHEFGWEEVKKCHFRKDDHAIFRKGSGKPSDNKNIRELNDCDTKNDAMTLEQDLTERVIEDFAQLNLNDANDIPASTSKESEYSSFVPTENEQNRTELVCNRCDDISITPPEDTEIDNEEETKKKTEHEEISNAPELCPLMSSDVSGTPSEGTKEPDMQLDKTGSREENSVN